MNAHKKHIVRTILAVLAEREGLMSEALLHGEVALRTTPPATLSDFEDRLEYCQSQKWVQGSEARLGGRNWMITQLGDSIRRDL
jgi:hypothetical protein